MFTRIDEERCGFLDQTNLKWALRNYGITLLDEEIYTLLKSFDSMQNNCINYTMLLSSLDNFTTDFRKTCIMGFYDKMQALLNGRITLEGLGKLFDARRHPEVFSGDRSEEEVFTEYIKNWGDLDPFVGIASETWLSYYSDISACVQRDDHFEKLALSPFNLSNC